MGLWVTGRSSKPVAKPGASTASRMPAHLLQGDWRVNCAQGRDVRARCDVIQASAWRVIVQAMLQGRHFAVAAV